MLSGVCVWRGQVKKLMNVFNQMNPQLFMSEILLH